MGATEQEFLNAREKRTRRQYELEALGYKFIRFRWRDFQYLREIVLPIRLLRSSTRYEFLSLPQ